MRLRALLVLLAVVPWATGCYVLDLLDEGEHEMDRYSGPKSTEAKPADAPIAANPQEKPTKEQLRRWWDKATTLGPTKADSGFVQCEIGGSIQFTKKTDCLTRGGHVRETGS